MRLRWHLVIIAGIIIATMIILPLPFFLAVFLAAAESGLYVCFILPHSKAIQGGGKKRLDR